jgi:Uma2 family endonuclease
MSHLREKVNVAEYEAYLRLPENRNRRFELVNGEIIEKLPTQRHADVIFEFIRALVLFLEKHPDIVASVLPEARYGVLDDPDNSRIPDLSVALVAKEELVAQGAAPYMPELAVEVKSPDDSYSEMREKAEYYLAHGSRMVILIFTEKRLVEVHIPGDYTPLTEDDMIDASVVLPGFTLPVRNLF